MIPSNKTGAPPELNTGHHPIKWHSPNMERGAPFHEVALPQHGQGGATLHKCPKNGRFSKKKVCFDLEMMGFFLQYDLGVMENVFHGVKGL
jgi:hypothetical protein